MTMLKFVNNALSSVKIELQNNIFYNFEYYFK